LLRLIKQLGSRLSGFIIEVSNVVTSKERLKQLFRVSLYSNAAFLLIANAVGALLGFVFWIIVTRVYPPEDVGLASAVIAAVGLLAMLSHLGLGMGLIRFLPHSGKNANSMINTTFTIGTLTSVTAAFIFIAGLGFWSPALVFLRQNPIYFVAFVVFSNASTLWMLVGEAFVAERRAGFVLAKDLISSLLRLPLPIVLVAFFHSFGIFASWGISLGVALLLSVFLFLPRAQPGYRPLFAFNRGIVNDMLHFSFANYLSVLFWSAPSMILPIIVINLLGAELQAYSYIAWAMAGVFTMIPEAISTSLFAEGCHDEETLGLNTWRSLKMTFLILVPAVILIAAIADKLLLLFGGSYSENATGLLRILAISAIPVTINVVYLAIKRVEKNLKIIVGLTIFIAIATLALSYVLLPMMGINGAGIAWLITQTAIALVIVAALFKRRRALRLSKKTLNGES